MNCNLPKFAKFSSFGDKSIICEVCSISVKNLNQFNFKHIRSEEHINNVKKYLMKLKDNDGKIIENIKNNNFSEKNNDNKTNNSGKDKNVFNIDTNKIEIIKENLLKFDKEIIDDNIIELPKGFYDDDIKKDKNDTKEIKKEDKEIKNVSTNNKIQSNEEINNNIISNYNLELVNEAEEKKLISKKRKPQNILNNKNETKENLLEDILN